MNNNNGTITGAVQTAGIIGNALSFDGLDDWVQIPFDPSLDVIDNNGPFTLTAWIALRQGPLAADRGAAIFTQDGGTTPTSGKVWFTISKTTDKIFSPMIDSDANLSDFNFTGSLNTWHHVAAVFDSGDPSVRSQHNSSDPSFGYDFDPQFSQSPFQTGHNIAGPIGDGKNPAAAFHFERHSQFGLE